MSRRTRYLLVLVLAAMLVNLPLANSLWTDRRLDANGVDLTAAVVTTRTVGDQHVVTFRLPASVEGERVWTADLEPPAYERARSSGEVRVRVLESDGAAHRVAGEVESRALLIVTLIGDLVLALVAVLLWRYGGRRRPQLRAIAVGDVEESGPGAALDRQEGETYLVRGQVTEVGSDRLVIELGDRSVLVLLDGHRNPVGHQQSAQVRARLV